MVKCLWNQASKAESTDLHSIPTEFCSGFQAILTPQPRYELLSLLLMLLLLSVHRVTIIMYYDYHYYYHHRQYYSFVQSWSGIWFLYLYFIQTYIIYIYTATIYIYLQSYTYVYIYIVSHHRICGLILRRVGCSEHPNPDLIMSWSELPTSGGLAQTWWEPSPAFYGWRFESSSRK
jgi:hypothetical protein